MVTVDAAPPRMQSFLRYLSAAGCALLATALSAPLAAQTTSPTATSSASMTRDIYVLAYRSSAKQWCESGARDALSSALTGTHAIVERSVADPERAGVQLSLDSAYASLLRRGGCAALTSGAGVVLVDRFDGVRWNADVSELARGGGLQTEDGLTTVTRSVKLGPGRRHRYKALADYTFTTQGGQLVRGRYRVPATAKNADELWSRLEAELVERYPTLHVVRVRPRAANGWDGPGLWKTTFTNPDTQALEAMMVLTPAGEGRYEIGIYYPGYSQR